LDGDKGAQVSIGVDERIVKTREPLLRDVFDFSYVLFVVGQFTFAS